MAHIVTSSPSSPLVNLIDIVEPDGPYNFILNYQDHLTKFLFSRPLKTKTASSRWPLQSDNGREFAKSVIVEVTTMWPGLKIVHGRPRHSQSQAFVERPNQAVRDMLITWVNNNNNAKWSEGLRFIQSKKNRSFHRGICRSPYKAMFGSRQTNGLECRSSVRCPW
ncbi:KRAB-A domain-containing protein 2-like [Diabrotica undecimpunctata]|uniref:KRAB-A domain-containing protein 2-like n=1 Tax=Diabrotica undecimpunctata TaxID=50387 RepID=UPI003B6319B5